MIFFKDTAACDNHRIAETVSHGGQWVAGYLSLGATGKHESRSGQQFGQQCESVILGPMRIDKLKIFLSNQPKHAEKTGGKCHNVKAVEIQVDGIEPMCACLLKGWIGSSAADKYLVPVVMENPGEINGIERRSVPPSDIDQNQDTVRSVFSW